MADEQMFEDFTAHPETRWRFLADTVMGGRSSGQLVFVRQENDVHARLTGLVSTRNNGGFIQMRMDLPCPPPDDTRGLRLIVRGNDQRYFVHLRTTDTARPWQFYQAGFDVTRDWAEVRLPFDAFRASGGPPRNLPSADRLTSVGIAAYGRDHEAELDLREVEFFA